MSADPTPRTARLRKALGLSQADFAERLGVSQSTASRLELGQPETGPQSLLLDLLETQLASAPPQPPAPAPTEAPHP